MSKYSQYSRSSQAVEESKKKTSLLKDNSWIRKDDDEDEPVDRDPNFAKSVLSRYRSSETIASGSEADDTKTTKPVSTSTSVQALTKRFSASQDELRSSTLPSSKTTASYTKRYSSVKTDGPNVTKTTVTEEPKTSSKTTTVTKNGTTETTVTTTQTVKSPVIKSPSKTETFTERVRSSSKGPQYSTYSPTRTTEVTEKTVSSPKDTEDKLYDTLIPSSLKNDSPTTDSKTTVTTTETVTVKSSGEKNAEDKLYDSLIPKSVRTDVPDSKTTVSRTETVTMKSVPDSDGIKTTTTTTTKSTSSRAEDQLYDTLLPKSITSDSPTRTNIMKRESVTVESSKGGESPTQTSPSSTRTDSYSSYTNGLPSSRSGSYGDSYSSDRKSYSYSRPDSSYEYTSITSPTVYTTTSYRSSSRSDDVLADPIYSKSSMKRSSERPVLEKDLCSNCHKPFTGDAKMVLEDMKINCHATCFRCDVCNSTLGNLKAGDTMWIYKRMVHCENCFEVTREKWHR